MISVLELRSVRGTGGGPEKTILLGAARHDRRLYRVTVCYIRDIRDTVFGIDERARQLGVDYVEVRERHSFDRRIWRELVRLVRERHIDIVHGHDYKTNLIAWLLRQSTGARPLGTAHGWTGQSARERWVYYPAERAVLARFPRVIAVSSDVRDRLVRAGADPARVTVLLNGIDPAAFRRDDGRRRAMRAALGIGNDVILIGSVGRLERQKRFDLLLEALAGVRRTHARVELAIVGDGSLRGPLETLANTLGLGPACRFLGHRLDIVDLHCAFDVFVQSSEYEGTPNSVLEAMAMETPIVATDAGGTRELARHDREAVIVPIQDVAALTAAIERVLNDPSAANARVAAARERVENDLSFEGRTRTLERIYDELMAGQPQTASAGDETGIRHA